MIKKTLFQGFVAVACFAALWLGLSQIDFMRVFKVDQATSRTEEKLGELFWETIERTETIIRNDSVNRCVDKIVTRITDKNGIDRDEIKVHVIEKSDVNAFAMPGNHLVIFSGLIAECENEEELAGVIGHEIAHIRKKHVMKKLVKEVGLSVLLSMATGGKGTQAIQEAAHMLSSSAYDRKLESEADYTSADYLINAKINPEPFANFLFKMTAMETVPSAFYWISTHPESEERAKAIVSYIKDKKKVNKKVLTAAEWKFLKDKAEKY